MLQWLKITHMQAHTRRLLTLVYSPGAFFIELQKNKLDLYILFFLFVNIPG
jgi:hypothetical protein